MPDNDNSVAKTSLIRGGLDNGNSIAKTSLIKGGQIMTTIRELKCSSLILLGRDRVSHLLDLYHVVFGLW